MLSEFLLPDSNFLEELFRFVVWGLLLLAVLLFMVSNFIRIFLGESRLYHNSVFKTILLRITTILVNILLIGFIGFGFYNTTKTFVVYLYADIWKDAVTVKKYYNIKPKYERLEFTLKEPLPYSYVLKDKIAVPILHEDSKEYQVEYNEHIYKIEK